MAKKSGAQVRKRTTPRPFDQRRDTRGSEITVKFVCPICAGPHPRAECRAHRADR